MLINSIRKSRKMLVLVAVVVLTLGLVSWAIAADAQGQGSKFNMGQIYIDKLAAILGINNATLETAIKDAGKQMLDEAVTQGKMTQEQADRLQGRINNSKQFFLGPWQSFKHGKAELDKGMGIKAFAPDQIAEALGITAEDLKSALQQGQTLESIASDNGLSLDQLKEKLVALVKEKLDEAVAAGKLTSDQAGKVLEKLQQMDFQKLEAKGDFRGPRQGLGRMPGMFRGDGNNATPDSSSNTGWLQQNKVRQNLKQL